MIQEIKKLRVNIDGLAQLTKELKPLGDDKEKGIGIIEQIYRQSANTSKEIEKAVDSLYLAKAWLGKVLGELGNDNPYKSGYKTKEDIVPTADVAKYYHYRITLSSAAFRKHDGSVLIYFDRKPKVINNIEFEFSSSKKLTKNEVKDKIKGTSYVLDITGDFLTLEEDIEATQDVNDEVPFGDSEGDLWRDKNHIEKVDWLREEIKKVTNEVKVRLHFVHSERMLLLERVEQYLSEARFWLGFELERIKNIK